MAGGAGFVDCWVGSAFYRGDLPLNASRVAFQILNSILGENASAATIWWPFLETLMTFILNMQQSSCATTMFYVSF